MTDNENGTIVSYSTPLWVTDQRQRRQNRRGYGRRHSNASGAGGCGSIGIRNTSTKLRTRRAALLGTPVSARPGGSPLFDDEIGDENVSDDDAGEKEEGEDLLDHSAHARLQGTRGHRPPPPQYSNDYLDKSAHARLEGVGQSVVASRSNSGGLDLIDEFEHMSKPKKKRPNLPRPPRAAIASIRAAAAKSMVSPSSQFTTSKVDSSPSAFKTLPTNSDSVVSSFSTVSGDGLHDKPAVLMEETPVKLGKRGAGVAKRSKISYRRSNSTTAATISSSTSMFVENVHPNDTTFVTAANDLSNGVGTRRSSRLQKSRRNSSIAAAGSALSLMEANGTAKLSANNNIKAANDETSEKISVTTRSRAKANSKKRSATLSVTKLNLSSSQEKDLLDNHQQLSPPKTAVTRSTSQASFSSVSFLSSNSSTRNAASSSNGGATGESFSSLARQSYNTNWVTGKKKSGHQQRKRLVSLGSSSNKGSCTSVGGNSAFNSASNSALKTPSANNTLCRCPISRGGDPFAMGSTRMASPSFTSPSSALSTPSVGSASSRKRRTMEFMSSSSNNDDDDQLPSSECTRSMLPIVMGQLQYTSGEFAPTSLGVMLSETVGFPPAFPKLSSFSKSLTGGVCDLIGSDDDNDNDDEKQDGVRDRLLFDNDESMVSTESDDESNSSSLEDGEDNAGAEKEDFLREMTDAEIFAGKPSYDDFKFLMKSLLKWAQSSQASRGCASMGLNNGCLVAVPSGWTFDRRANFAKWAATAFGFRVGSVGGAGCGSFLRCGDGEGRAVLARLRRILADDKAGRLTLPLTKGRESNGGFIIKKDVQNGESIDTKLKAKTKLPIKMSSMRQSSGSLKKVSALSMSPLCDDFVGDLLADGMKGISLDEKKHLARSKTHKPLANKIKNVMLPCLRSNSPTVESRHCLPPLSSETSKNGSLLHLCSNSPTEGDNSRRSGGVGGAGHRPPRLSSECIVNGPDFINQLHGVMGSPSPLPSRFPRRLRDRASHALQLTAPRPGFGVLRSSFDRTSFGGQQQSCLLKPFESPHPRNSLLALLETPTSHLEFAPNPLETPMPKEIENWGSRPVFGKDWGESDCCCNGTIDICNQIFAKSWFTSEFHSNTDLSVQYQVAMDEDDKNSLFVFYDADVNLPNDDNGTAILNDNCMDEFPTDIASKKIGFARCDSVGATAFDLLHLDDKGNDFGQSPNRHWRHSMKLRKYARMSLCVAATSDLLQLKPKRCYRLSESPMKKRPFVKGTPINRIVEDSMAFSHVLSFLNEGELIHLASLVCTSWADTAAEALGKLMLMSVGCDQSYYGTAGDADNLSEAAESGLENNTQVVSPRYSSVTESMRRDWLYLMGRFPWAHFLSDGAFKRVYKVWNNRCGAYEALSVMDVDAINDLGNLNLVGSELAVSVLLSSLTRRHICPNFVVTRGVFTCHHQPPASLWGCRGNAAPRGTTFDGHTLSNNSRYPESDLYGNYQYIRMELCQHGDIEGFIKSHPEKMLPPQDCRNLLLQMAFALHAAGNRFGLKHYDVKLLNFLLQSAKDPTITDEQHPYVVLRYGVGSHVFRLRMQPSSAYVAKLADFGTSVMRTDTDGQPVSLGQFTTLENTPPDYLILGNSAEQGYGHDSFGLGLCMLHLFTGHGPYEEILDEVVCPENLKGKLRKIWKQKSHDVICSVMYDNDENGREIEDETLYNTLYRFLVLFGIPKRQFGIKKHGKVWHAINSTLLPLKGTRFKKTPDADLFEKDKKKFSLANGSDKRIAGARSRLQGMYGAMELLLSLVEFDPNSRATPLQVINSDFMADLVEDDSISICEEDMVKSYTTFLTNNHRDIT